MKKNIVILAFLAMQQFVLAQTVNVHFKNGQVIEFPSDNIDYVDFSNYRYRCFVHFSYRK